MFGNFLYFIVVLLIYSTYQPPESPLLPVGEALAGAVGLLLLFAAYALLAFGRLGKKLERLGPAAADVRHSAMVTRLCVLAVALFAVDVYGLNLPAYLSGLPGLRVLPTLQALLFLVLFIGYLAIGWAAAHPTHDRILRTRTSRRGYVAANIAFGIPVILPWLVLSGVADLIELLPFEAPRRWLASPAGEMGYFLFFLILVAVAGPVLIRRFWRCRPLAEGPDRRRIVAVCQRAGLRFAEILDWPLFEGRMITAGVMGLVRRFRYILVTRAMLAYLAPEEVEQVIAHEVGHVKRHHLIYYLLFLTGYLILAYAAFDLVIYALLYARPFQWLSAGGASDPTRLASILLNGCMVALFLLYFRFIFGYFMRNFERQADLYVYRLYDDARPLIATLVKIAATSGIAPEKPNWHHFSIRQRVDYLLRCQADPAWINRHDRKVRRSLAVYLTALILVGITAWQLNFGAAGRQLNRHLLQTIVSEELARDPRQPDLLVLLGDLHYQHRDLKQAAEAYEQAVVLDPNHPQGLNNLAWLYATGPVPDLRHPARALELALRAAALDPAPHVLDTLAESYYVNGRYADAEATGHRALDAAGNDNRAYFEGQLKKFSRARERAKE